MSTMRDLLSNNYQPGPVPGFFYFKIPKKNYFIIELIPYRGIIPPTKARLNCFVSIHLVELRHTTRPYSMLTALIIILRYFLQHALKFS